MRFDLRNQLSNNQTFTATAVSTNSMQKKEATQDLGVGQRQMGLVIGLKDDAVDSGTPGATFEIQLIEADNGPLSSNVKVLSSLGAMTPADLKAGKAFFLGLPPYKMSKAYFGARVVVVSGGGTAPSLPLDIYFGSEDDVANYKSFKTPYNVQN